MDCPIRRRPYPFWVFALDVIYIYVCVLYMYIYIYIYMCVTCVCVCDMRVCVCYILFANYTLEFVPPKSARNPEVLRITVSLGNNRCLVGATGCRGMGISIHTSSSIHPSVHQCIYTSNCITSISYKYTSII